MRRIAQSILAVVFLSSLALASDLDGIWVGQQQGRGGPEDIAFRFQVSGDSGAGQTVTGKLFGDEADLPISEGSLAGDQVRFVVTTTNYYNGTKTKFLYTGILKGLEMELTRERIPTPDDRNTKAPPGKQTLKLKRIK